MSRISYGFRRGAFGEEEGLLLDFESLGGQAEVLVYLLDNRGDAFLKQPEPPRALKSQAVHMEIAARNFQALGFKDEAVASAKLAAKSLRLRAAGRSSGRPVLRGRYYWIGALVPYMTAVAGKPSWPWLNDWLRLLEGDREFDVRVATAKATKFLKVNPWQKGGAIAVPNQTNQQREVSESMLVGIEACMLGLRGASTTDNDDLDIRHWLRNWGRTKTEKRFYEAAIDRWPLLKLDIDERMNG